MSTIDSLDLATLTNNPADIATALESVLTATNSTITQLKQDAQDAKDAIDLLKISAQADHDAIETLLNDASSTETTHITSLNTNWYAWTYQGQISTEHGIMLQRFGKVYVGHLSIYKNVGIGDGNEVVCTVPSADMTRPGADVLMGTSRLHDSPTQTETVAQFIFQTDGDIHLYWHNNIGNDIYMNGVFVGVDQG